MRNRQKAQERPDLYMSLIIDGMAQDHCQLPYYAGCIELIIFTCRNFAKILFQYFTCLGKNVETKQVVKQKIMGAKQHGFSRKFYRLFPHVQSGANVAIEVLLHEVFLN